MFTSLARFSRFSFISVWRDSLVCFGIDSVVGIATRLALDSCPADRHCECDEIAWRTAAHIEPTVHVSFQRHIEMVITMTHKYA